MADKNVRIVAEVEVKSDDAGQKVGELKKEVGGIGEAASKSGAAINETVGSLKQQMRQAQNEVAALSDKFGATSKQAIEAAKRAADLKDRIGDAKALTDAFNPDAKFKALSSSLSGVAGGFSAVQGAVGLFGKESKELEKQLLKVQSALALSQGLQSIGESIDSFKQLGAVIKTQVVTAFSTLRGALIATGIGALAVSVGLIAANFDKVKKAVLDFIPGLSRVGDFIGNLVNKVTDFIGVTSEAGRATAKLLEDNEKAIKRSEIFLDLNGDKYDQYTQRKIKANLDFKKQQNEFLKDEKLTEDERNAYILQAREKANREILNADKDREEAAAKTRKEAYEKQKRLDEERLKEQKRIEDAVIEARRKYGEIQIQLTEKRIEDAKKQEEEDNKEVERLFELEEKKQAGIIEIRNKSLEEQKKLNDAELNATIYLQDAKLMATSAGINALGALVGQNEKIANALFVLDKALAIGKVVVDTQREIAGYAAANSVFGPAGLALTAKMALAAKIRAAAGIATIAATTIAKFKTGSSDVGGPNVNAVPSINTNAPLQSQPQTTRLDQGQINQIGSFAQAPRAYVVESDVSNAQERANRLNRAATIL